MRSIRLQAIKKSGKQKLFIIPYVFTFLNACFGFLSIIKTLECDFIMAAYCIILAVCMDLFDGRLARAFGSTSYFGMELDSLCDVISFCLAPAILLYNWYLADVGLVGFVVLSFYLCTGLSRLARFNTVAHENKTFFVGLPAPVAAFLISEFVLRAAWIDGSAFSFLLNDAGLLGVITILGLLMISRVRFPSCKYYTLRSRFTYFVLIGLVVALLFCAAYGYPFFFFATLTYLIGGPLYQYRYA